MKVFEQDNPREAMSAEGDNVLVFYPTTNLPYVLGALSFAMGVAAAISYVTRSSNNFDVIPSLLAVFFIGAGVIIIGLRLAGFPRLRMEGNTLTLEPGFGKPLKPFDLAQYGRAMAFPMRLGTSWTTHIGFPTRRAEIALHVSGNSELIDRFSVAQAIGVTAIVGLNLRKAQAMADVINANRPSKANPNIDYREISSISRAALSKRWGIKLIYVAMCACFLLYYAIKFVTS